MRLAIIRRRYAQFGGAERFIETSARVFVREGIGVTIVSEVWPGARDELKPVAVQAGGFTRASRLRHFQREVAAVLTREKFDLVQTHERLLTADIFRAGDGVHAAWVARQAAERGGLRSVLMRLDPMHRLVIATERRMARETQMLFVANSDLVAREIAEWLGVPANRIRTIENGVNTVLFRPPRGEERRAARARFGLDDDEPVVAFVGSGFERKGAFQLIEALALSMSRNIHALIAGRDRQLEGLRRQVEALGLAQRVHILGGIDDPVAVYHAADAFVLPSLYDPMPNAALEALACGLPLVVTADTGIADAVRVSNAGVVVMREPDSIAAGIVATLGRRAEMARAALSLAPHFDFARASEHWLALYRELT